MARPAKPQPRASASYRPGETKRIIIRLFHPGAPTSSIELSTAEARRALQMLADAIRSAEADKIATRSTRKRTKRAKSVLGVAKPPSRLRRVESAALHLQSTMAGAVVPRAVAEALKELSDALGASGSEAAKQAGMSR